MIQLTQDQHDQLATNGRHTTEVLDPITKTKYLLVRAELLDGMIDADFHVSDAYPAIDEAFAEGWNHPKMSDYDHYEDFKK